MFLPRGNFGARDTLAGIRYAHSKLTGPVEPVEPTAPGPLRGPNARAVRLFIERAEQVDVEDQANAVQALKPAYLGALVRGGLDADRVDAQINEYFKRYGSTGRLVFAGLQR